METIEIIIRIPKDTFDAISILQVFVDDKHLINGYQIKGNSTIGTMIKAIAAGTVLPKGHGDLVDKQKLLSEIDTMQEAGSLREYGILFSSDVENARAVIEADKAESEMQNADSD